MPQSESLSAFVKNLPHAIFVMPMHYQSKPSLPGGQPDLQRRLRDLHHYESLSLRVDSKTINAARSVAGQDTNLHHLQQVLLAGSCEERIALRPACATAEAAAHNQDLNLPRLMAALKGDQMMLAEYQRSRAVISENLPEWAKSGWELEASASWRAFDLHGKQMRRFARSVHSSVLPRFRTITIPPCKSDLLPVGGRLPDERIFFLTYAIGRDEIGAANERAAASTATRDEQRGLADVEIQCRRRSLSSPTPIGAFFREVAKHELCLLFSAFLVEDFCVAFDIPLSGEGKRTLWREMAEHWERVGTLVPLAEVQRLTELLRGQGMAGDQLTEELSRLAVDPHARARLLCPPADEGNRTHSLSGSAPIIPPAMTDGDPPELPEPVLHPSSRLIIAAILESCGQTEDLERNARVLVKLTGGGERELKRIAAAMQCGVPVPELVNHLRAERPLSVLRERNGNGAPIAGQTKAGNTSDAVPAPEPVTFIFSEEAREAFRDGRLRHAVDGILQKFAETPELMLRRKIKTTTDVWELKEGRWRVYYFHAGQHRVGVLLAGDKLDQKFQIEKLQAIREREKLRIDGQR